MSESARSRFGLLAALAVLATVLLSSYPIFGNPQLEPDDYRYLDLVARLDGPGDLWRAFVVENRWDRLWWIDSGEPIRFFRPPVLLSYLADDLVHGGSATGLLATNLCLHLGCCLLVLALFVELFGRSLAALAGSLLFAAFFCHGETIWYVAGRTDTLAALGFVGGLVLHARGLRLGGVSRWLAVACYGFALFAKELTVFLPLLCFFHERVVVSGSSTRRAPGRRWPIYAAFGGVALVYFGLRALAMPEGSGPLVFPYFVTPARAEFLGHLWAQVSSYAENLVLARTTKPFLQPDELAAWHAPLATGVSLVALALLCWPGWRDPRLWLFLLLAGLAWAPTLLVYVSERYLYLPSIGCAGLLALAIAGLADTTGPRRVLVVVGAVWIVHQAAMLGAKHDQITKMRRDPQTLEHMLARHRREIPKGARLYFVDFPFDWTGQQFLEPILRTILADPTLSVRVLTPMPDARLAGVELGIVERGAKAFELVATGPVLARDGGLFPWSNLSRGLRVARPELGYSAEVLVGTGDEASRVLFRFEEPLDEAIVLRFRPLVAAELGRYPGLDTIPDARHRELIERRIRVQGGAFERVGR